MAYGTRLTPTHAKAALELLISMTRDTIVRKAVRAQARVDRQHCVGAQRGLSQHDPLRQGLV